MKPNYEHRDEDVQAQQSLVNYKPIIFSRAMIHALQNDAKIETRRPVNPSNEVHKWLAYGVSTPDLESTGPENNLCPYGVPGDILWVREKFAPPSAAQIDDAYMYAADYPVNPFAKGIWRPSIHMPRKACRIFLEVESRKLQRIQDITPDECMHEGVEFADDMGLLLTAGPVQAFHHLWDSMYGSHEWKAWAKNPLVWAVRFRVLKNHKP